MSPAEIVALAEVIKNISEVVWSVAMAKVYADALACLLWGCLFLAAHLGSWVFYILSCRKKDKNPKSDWDIGIVVSVICAGCTLAAVGGFFSAAIVRLAAPAYFAIQIIANLT